MCPGWRSAALPHCLVWRARPPYPIRAGRLGVSEYSKIIFGGTAIYCGCHETTFGRRSEIPNTLLGFGTQHKTRVCSPELPRRPGGAGDDNALPAYGLGNKARCVRWAALSEHKW